MSTAGSPPPLVARAAANDLGGVTSLLTARPAMDAVNEETLDTALHCAARNRNVDMMRALLSAGADPTLRNRACETPLAICIAADHAEAVNTLLEHGAARALFVHGWRNDALLFTVPRDTPATPARAAIMRAVDEALEVFVRDLPTETSAEAEAAVISCPFDFASAASTASGAGAAAPGVTAAAAAGHQGSWRGPDRRFYCSIAGQVDGPLCEHGGGINREHHYSCCGATSASAPCTAAGRRAGAGGASGGASGSSGHSGEYRDVDSGRLTRYCSLRSDREGMLCAHSAGIVRSSHWSCCGARSRDAACTAGAGAGASASSAGATGGGEGLGHSGAFRRDPRRFYCSKPGAQAEGPLCEHGSAIVRAEHWSCCGVTAASGRCTRPGAPAAGAAAPTPHAATSTPASAAAAGASGARHTGSWRGTGKTRFCSLATDRDGPVCMHINPGPIVPDDHWSCCGAKTQTGPCLFALPPAFSVGDRVVRGVSLAFGGCAHRFRLPCACALLHPCESLLHSPEVRVSVFFCISPQLLHSAQSPAPPSFHSLSLPFLFFPLSCSRRGSGATRTARLAIRAPSPPHAVPPAGLRSPGIAAHRPTATATTRRRGTWTSFLPSQRLLRAAAMAARGVAIRSASAAARFLTIAMGRCARTARTGESTRSKPLNLLHASSSRRQNHMAACVSCSLAHVANFTTMWMLIRSSTRVSFFLPLQCDRSRPALVVLRPHQPHCRVHSARCASCERQQQRCPQWPLP